MKRKYGDHRVCAMCGTDIEWHGREHGWSDRGGNHHCDTGGQHPVDENGAWGTYPHRKHKPEGGL